MLRHVSRLLWLVPALLLTAGVAQAQVQLNANLTGGEEAPTAVSTGSLGTAVVSIDTTNREITVSVQVYNLPTGATGGHIHVGAAGVAGPVIFDLAPVAGTTGDFTLNQRLSSANLVVRATQGILTIDDAIQALSGGNCYINIHSATNPGGEIRGQLIRTR